MIAQMLCPHVNIGVRCNITIVQQRLDQCIDYFTILLSNID